MSVAIVPFDGEHKFVMHCDFCAKPESEVSFLISSPNGSHICDQCVDVCHDIVSAKRALSEADQ